MPNGNGHQNGSLHKLVFAPTANELTKLLRKEARGGWQPSKFKPQPVRDGVLLVLEKNGNGQRVRLG